MTGKVRPIGFGVAVPVVAGAMALFVTLAVGIPASAQASFVPPAGYGGPGKAPGVAVPSDPDTPRLTRLPDAGMGRLIRVDPDYRRGMVTAHAKVVGAFAIAETRKSRLQGAWAPGFLPVALAFSDGRCFSLQADYIGGTLSNGRLSKVACEAPRPSPRMAQSPPPPAGRDLRLIGSAWSYDAWADARSGTTIIAKRNAKMFQPLFTAQMVATAIMAMDSPDAPQGNVTLVGRVNGRLTVLTLEVAY